MGLENNVKTIRDLNPIWPPIGDPRAQGADHLRNIKTAVQGTFPNLTTFPLTDKQVTAVEKVVGKGDGSDLDYVQRAIGANDYSPIQAGVQKSSGNIWLTYNDGSGLKYAFAQQSGDYATNAALSQGLAGKQPAGSYAPAGDYATNAALRSEESSRWSADTNLQNQVNNRVLRTGDAIDWLRVNGALWVFGSQCAVHNSVVNAWVNTYVDNSGAATWELNGGSPSNYTGNRSWLRLYADGNLRTNRGTYALQSELPTDLNKIILAWNGYVGGGDQSIPFPRGLSGVDTVIVVCSKQVSGGRASAVINVQGWNNSSVQVNSVWISGGEGYADVNYRAILIGNK